MARPEGAERATHDGRPEDLVGALAFTDRMSVAVAGLAAGRAPDSAGISMVPASAPVFEDEPPSGTSTILWDLSIHQGIPFSIDWS